MLLVITYRSPFLWLVPLTVVGVADQLAAVLATHTLAAFGVPGTSRRSASSRVLVFGAGTDYALLLISRYRDELRVTEDRREAMATPCGARPRPCSPARPPSCSACSPCCCRSFPATRGLGLACAVGVVVAAIFALVVLPAALVVFGRWIFWPKVPQVGAAGLADGHSFWRRVGDAVANRPAGFVTVTVIVAGRHGVRHHPDPDRARRGRPVPEKPEAIAAGERLAESFPAGDRRPGLRHDPRRRRRSVADACARSTGVSAVRVAASGERRHRGRRRDRRAGRLGRGRRHRRGAARRRGRHPDTHVGGTEAEALDAAERRPPRPAGDHADHPAAGAGRARRCCCARSSPRWCWWPPWSRPTSPAWACRG